MLLFPNISKKNMVIDTIKKAGLADCHQLMQLDQTLFQASYWDEKQWEYELLENAFANLYVIYMDHQLIGYIDYWITFETAQIAKIGVHPQYQKKGIGKLLLCHAIKECERSSCETMSLEVRMSNQKAIAFYKSFCFEKLAIRKQYYKDGEDAYYMMKVLGGESL